MKLLQISLISTLSFISIGCGGGGGGGSNGNSPAYSCFGSGSSYLCTPVGSGTATTPAPAASAFPILTSFATVINSGISASGLETTPYAPGTFNVSKSPAAAATFNGSAVLAQISSTNWTTGGYPTPYTQYYDSSYNLVGFFIAGLYGKRTNGTTSMPAAADNGSSGTLGQFTLYSDSGLTTQAGTATLTYSVNNCCDLYEKKKADLKLTLTFIQLSGAVMGTLTQKYVVTTTGGVKFGYEKFNDGTNDRELFYAYGGY
jgi:hypothetical protein